MKNLINDYISNNNAILEFLDTVNRDYENVDKRIPLFVDKLRQTKFNAALGIEFANSLQLSNDRTIFEQYDLEDISNLFASLLKLQDFNLDTYVEACHFEWSVMNNGKKAKEIANEGMEKAKQKIEELQQILISISND